jgi:multisubunit Na+/H+ antiporter MnhG subunit
MKSKSKLGGAGILYIGLFFVFLVLSGLLFKIILVAILWYSLKAIFFGKPYSQKGYTKSDNKSNDNIPPALAKKLARRT